MDKFDCVVIGSGLYGLGAAKQFHALHPECTLVVFEAEGDIGGTWASHRIYPGLRSNNLHGTYEFPDFPMSPELFGIRSGEHIPGMVINAYLKAYADKFGIRSLIRLNTKVTVAEHQSPPKGGWLLTVSGTSGEESRVFARRLIISTGLTSEPFVPYFEGQEVYGGKVFHGKHFLQNQDTIKAGTSVTVLGGSKLAWDAVYMYATAGVKVNWVIRDTRFLTWFSPCIWGEADGYKWVRRFLHGTTVGRFIVEAFWTILGKDVASLMNLDSHPDTAKLKPWISSKLTSTSFSLLNYETDILELVRSEAVDVYVGDLERLSPGKVHLTDGTELISDALLAHTGWIHTPSLRFRPEGIERELGIPYPLHSNIGEADHTSEQETLMQEADKEILRRFPSLKDGPEWDEGYAALTDQKGVKTSLSQDAPWMLYRFTVPSSSRFLATRDTAFVGMVSNFGNAISAHLQGLWVGAYFSGQLLNNPSLMCNDREALSELQKDTMLHNRFGKWRYPIDWGNKAPSFIFDAVPFYDVLLTDLGLSRHRKGGPLAEIFSPYGPRDYQDVNEEWVQRYATKRGLVN